jgi:hypothetical protein
MRSPDPASSALPICRPSFAGRGQLSRRLAVTALLAGCGSTDPAAPPDTVAPYAPPPASVVVETGAVAIRREVLRVPAPAPPPNPDAANAAQTPADYNAVRVVRYRLDTGSAAPRPARAIVVLMPGFLGGAGSYDPLARALVRRSTADEAIEAWAIDRRSNFLEDHHGLEVAQVRKDPELASGYYFGGQSVEGKAYAGVRPPSDLSFMSEWGLASTIADLRAAIALVPAGERKGRVVLVGHSLGASIVEEYAAWDFDGQPGYDELAGLVLIDGTSASEGAAAPSISQQQYLDGITLGGFPTAGLTRIRKDSPYFVLPLLGSDVYPVAGVLGLRAALRPGQITTDPDRDAALRILLGLSQLPSMTNRAALGFAFDRAYNSLSFAAVACGAAVGGPLAPYTGVLGDQLLHPSDPSATYDWIDYAQANPTGNTALSDLAQTWFQGPGLDFGEWYFPSRLSLDAPAAGTLVLAATDWPLSAYGLRASHGKQMDLPILAAAAALVGKGHGDTSGYDALRAMVAAVPIGPGRPAAGTPRTQPEAFSALGYPELTHIDPLMGADTTVSKSRAFYDELHRFALRNTPAGGVVIDPQLPTPP